MSSSVGVTIPNIWKNKTNVPNHQPVVFDSNGSLQNDPST
jgi:hypothetical protein